MVGIGAARGALHLAAPMIPVRMWAAAAAATVAAMLVASTARAQNPTEGLRDRGEVALHQALLDAASDQLVLFVASHPDDQYIQPAAIARFRYGWRVAVALLTRGEGGQNISGPEVGDALARRRTMETERCAARLGIDVFHLDCPDRGFCRGADETLQLWGRVRTSNDLARLIRTLRPDVVWTTHHPAEDHGHDLALLQILPDAVERAGSPTYAFDSLPPHRVHALLRSCAPGEPAELTLPGDFVDAVRGDTLRRLAYLALAEHRSQAPHRPIDEVFPTTLELRSLPINGSPAAPEPLTPTDLLAGLPAGTSTPLREAFKALRAARLGDRPALLAFALDARALLLATAGTGPDLTDRKARRLHALDRVIVHALGICWSPTLAEQATCPGATVPVALTIQNGGVRSLDALTLRGRLAHDIATIDGGSLSASGATTLPIELIAPPVRALLAPTYAPEVSVIAELRLAEQVIEWPIPVPIDVRPSLEIETTQPSVLLPNGRSALRVAVRLRNNGSNDHAGLLLARAPVPMRASPESVELTLPSGATRVYMFSIDVPAGLRAGVHSLRFQFGPAAAEFTVHAVDVSVPAGLRVGLIPGVDDTSRRVLEDFGVQLHVLDGDDVATFELETLHTVVVDIRALRVQDTARAAFDRLLEFVRKGGRLLVLYHKDMEWESPGFQGAPYPMQIGRDRVTQEDAPVRVLLPEHRLMRVPNRLQSQDWDGWAQERGLYFAKDYDSRFEELLAMADRGEPELRGGLLHARYGEGEYVYCALALFRQLKKFHPGAIRLFANLVASPRVR